MSRRTEKNQRRVMVRHHSLPHGGMKMLRGQSHETCTGGPDDEGYAYHVNRVTRERDGSVTLEYSYDMRDCDGRYTGGSTSIIDPRSGRIVERVNASRRDHTAEAAGY